ncbi:hypothetical protein BST28156_04343 [Burkholderia stagnalis]|nr:hypothetical protein BST28156_04343 [Burkholderia stagnalis]
MVPPASTDAIHVQRATGIDCGHKFQRLGSVEYGAYLFDGANSCFIQIDDHPQIINHPD